SALSSSTIHDLGPPQPGQPFKFTVGESCDRIKEEFNFLQAQYHNLKMECEKIAQEKTEMQRHYVMFASHSFFCNVTTQFRVLFVILIAIVGMLFCFPPEVE
ncbi:hypothetical protein L9F63_007093, partial [Diploptera punctata]